MFTTLQTRLKRAGRWLPVALLPLLPFAAQAQSLNYSPAGASNIAGTYTDLGTTGTAITTANTDDDNSAAQPIGFTFNFNGTAFTQFVLNTNGFLKLGATAPSATAMFLPATGGTNIDPFQSPNPADVNIVAPFNVDLAAGSGAGGAEYRVTTSGTAPNQVCTIQWKNLKDKTGGQFANFSFQVKLYQTTNNVDFIYDAPVASTAAPVFQFSQVGIKGSGFTSGQFVQALKQSAAAWSAATFASSLTTTPTGTTLNTLNYRNNLNPVAGTTYRFAPASANDAAVALIYTQGQLATFSPAHVVRARISNVGGSSYTGTATLTVTRGATTLFTSTKPVTALATGASAAVAFDAYNAATMANVGTNNVTVSLGTDDNPANNTKTLDQEVSATTVNYASPAVATTGAISFGPTGTGNAGSRFATTTPRLVTSIQAYLGSGTGTVAGVLFDATGAELGRSATRTLVAADANTLVTLTLTTPVNIGAGDFFAGLNLAAGAAVGAQDETPTRTATFYQINPGPALVDLASSNLGLLHIGAITAAATTTTTCLPVTALTAGSITTTGASLSFTGPAAGTTYTVVYTPPGGTATTVTPAPTASPVVLTGLTAGTTYSVSVIANCGAGQTSSATTTVFTTLAVAPANDDCANAISLTLGTTCTNTVGTTQGATASTAPTPAPSCGGATLGPLADVWYKVTVPTSGNVNVTTSAVTGSLLTDTVLELYSGTCGALVSLGCNDDTGGSFSQVSLTGQTAGAVLYARVRSYGSTPQGQFNICVTNPVLLTNDNPSGAITLPVAATCTPVNGTNVGATTTTATGVTNPGCGIAASPKDVWFKFTTAASGVGSTNVSITVTGNPAGQVRAFSAATAAGPFTSIGCAAGTAVNTAAPVLRLANLTPSTTYYVFVSGYGSADTQGAFTICATGLAPTAPVVYVTLPYTEGFEATWADGLEIRSVPTASWKNTPSTGDNSWRREDDGFTTLSGSSANWKYPDNEQPTAIYPIPPYNVRSSVGAHSARFHSFGSDSGTKGTLDLYVNMSSTSGKTLNFDYINPTGTDSLKVFLSTNGGVTFGAVPLRKLGTSATFSPVGVIAIPSTSATTVIRFEATSDYGTDDLGIDNLRLEIETATTNAALAAQVSLYPNPARQSFQLSVPAGLRNASATLVNTLGQVVQAKQLSLSAAGGTADFNVSNLAAGVYTLTLKSGTDLVVKRVVVE